VQSLRKVCATQINLVFSAGFRILPIFFYQGIRPFLFCISLGRFQLKLVALIAKLTVYPSHHSNESIVLGALQSLPLLFAPLSYDLALFNHWRRFCYLEATLLLITIVLLPLPFG